MPYAFFRDTVNAANPNKHAGNIYSTQLCVEICQNTSTSKFIEEEIEDGKIVIKYEPGDSVYVELHSINYDSYVFLNEVAIQTNRPGGFAELFAQPLANVSSNIKMVNESSQVTKVIGFFNISAVSSLGKQLDPNNLPSKD